MSSVSIAAGWLPKAAASLELALGCEDSPLRSGFSEDSAWIGCICKVSGLTGRPAFGHAVNSVPAGERCSFTSLAGENPASVSTLSREILHSCGEV